MRGREVERCEFKLVDVIEKLLKMQKRERLAVCLLETRAALFFFATRVFPVFSSFVQHIHTISQCTTTIYYTMNTVYGKQTTDNSNRMMKQKDEGKKKNQFNSNLSSGSSPVPFWWPHAFSSCEALRFQWNYSILPGAYGVHSIDTGV